MTENSIAEIIAGVKKTEVRGDEKCQSDDLFRRFG
jgi:hypothetical protein